VAQRQVDDLLSDLVWNAAPDATRPGPSIGKGLCSTVAAEVVPAVGHEAIDEDENLSQGDHNLR
jgi:hypothetical protein